MKNINEENIDGFLTTREDHMSFAFNKEPVILADDLLTSMARRDKSSSMSGNHS